MVSTMSEVLTIKDVAKLYKMSLATVYRSYHKWPRITPSGQPRFYRDELERHFKGEVMQLPTRPAKRIVIAKKYV